MFADAASEHLVVVDIANGAANLVLFPGTESHGIATVHDHYRDMLWVADPGFKHSIVRGERREIIGPGRVMLLGTDGELLLDLPAPVPGWRPTAVAVHDPPAALTSPVWIADGYGSNLVHLLSSAGKRLVTVDGSETGIPFSTPHALLIDTRSREHLLVVADRGNRRLVHLRPDGSVHHVTESDVLTDPSGLAVYGDGILITQLDGTIAILKADGTVALTLRGGVTAPHGLLVTRAGRIFVTEWSVEGRALELLPVQSDTGRLEEALA